MSLLIVPLSWLLLARSAGEDYCCTVSWVMMCVSLLNSTSVVAVIGQICRRGLLVAQSAG